VNGVPITAETARGPMGKNKRDHISEILYSPHVAKAWEEAHGGAKPSEKDVDAMYAAFTPIQVAAARERAAPVPGAVELVAALRSRGIRVGGNSGYHGPVMEAVLEGAAAHGLRVDAYECAGPANGRPKPWMTTRVAEALDCFPLSSVVKVDDTIPGIVEGLNAGAWTVGVARSGNELGLPLADADALERDKPAEYQRRIEAARARLAAAGAHFVVDSVADLLPVIDSINAALEKGTTPLAV
jgi:phosphonoacetaldehyde hydrolase